MWQTVAIVALVVAAAGWTTVAVLVVGGNPGTAAASPEDSFDPEATDEETVPPVADTHDAPELEVFLPAALSGTALQVQSWNGPSILTDDGWSTSMTTFVTNAGKTVEDLHVAQAYDPTQALDGSIGVYRVAGVEGTVVRDALVAAWKVDYPEMVVSTVTLDGKEVTKCDFGDDSIDSYLYVRGDLVFDIETTDEAVAVAALAAIPAPGASPAPPASTAPTPTKTPAPSAS